MTKRKAGTASRAGGTNGAAGGAAAAPGGVAGSADSAGSGGDEAFVPDAGFTVPDSAAPGADGTGVDGVAAGVGGRKAGSALDIAITIGGLVVAVLLAVALAVFEAFLAPLHVSDLGFSGTGDGNMRVPLALVLALVTNPLLGWFASATTGRRFAALLPAGAWCVVWILAAGRTTEGDLLITNDNWVGLLTLFSGPLAFAVGIYVAAIRHRVAAPGNSKATPLAPQSVDR